MLQHRGLGKRQHGHASKGALAEITGGAIACAIGLAGYEVWLRWRRRKS
jgi:hypothetical protein